MTSVDRRRAEPQQNRLIPISVLPASGPVARSQWQDSYRRRLIVTDIVVVLGAVALGHIIRLGGDSALIGTADTSWAFVNYAFVSTVLALAWISLLAIFNSRSSRIVGSGVEEYQRIVSATMRLFGFVAMLALFFRLEIARGYLAIALPIGLIGLLLSRHLWRRWLTARQEAGEFGTSVLVIGSRAAASEMTAAFERDRSSGYRVVGACVPGALGSGHGVFSVGNREIPILGDEHAVVTALFATGADVVAVTATEHLGSAGIKRLAWDIEPYDVDLVVAPGVADAAETRLSLQPVGELPLLHVGRPSYHGATRFTKTAFDIVFASVALVVLSPILAIIAIAVKIDSPGRVLYRSERIGLDGTPFQMIKFRTMVEGADTKMAQLIASNESEGGVLFKMRHDPRVTRIGYYLRKFSLDELPQFVNVVKREMSVVGPRPPLRREVETYDGDVRRRLLVRPGVTGLWQVSGRSDLSWDESVRLDLSYVENWSMSLDLLIIAKTLRAVLGSDGAY